MPGGVAEEGRAFSALAKPTGGAIPQDPAAPPSRTPLEQIRSLVTDVLEGRRQYVDTYGDEAATLLARDIETILKDYEP